MHCPQLTQLETFKPCFSAGPTMVPLPRPTKSMHPTPSISSQTRTHFPQRMHFAGSRTIAGLEASRWCSGRVPKKRRPRTPSSAASSRNWQSLFRTQ